MDRSALTVVFIAGIAITVLFYIFLWKHRPYGRAKKLTEYAKENGGVTTGYYVKDFTMRHNINMPQSEWNRNWHKVKFRYTVEGREYYKWSRSEDIDNFQSSVTIYYDPRNPKRACTQKQYAAAHNVRIWWMFLFWIPFLILFYIGQALFAFR